MNKKSSMLASMYKTDTLLAFVLQQTKAALLVFDVIEERLEIHKYHSAIVEELLSFEDFYNSDLIDSGFNEHFIKDFKLYIQYFIQNKNTAPFEYLGNHIEDLFQWCSLSCFSYIDPNSSKHYIIGFSRAINPDKSIEELNAQFLSDSMIKKTILSSLRINITKKNIEEYNRYYGVKTKINDISFADAEKLNLFQVFKNKSDFSFNFDEFQTYDDVLKKGSKQLVFEQRVFFQNTYMWVEIHIHFSKNNSTHDLIAHCYIRDINEKKILALLREQDLFFEYEHLAYIEVDTGNLYYTSVSDDRQSLRRMYFDAYKSHFLKNIIVEEDKKYAAEQIDLKKIVRDLEENQFHTIFYGIKNRNNDYERKKCTYTFANKEKNIIALSVSDVTKMYREEEEKRKSLHDALEMAQNANIAKTEFLSRMSHELRTPLNAIMGLVVLSQQKFSDNPVLFENLSKINSSAYYLLSIINDVLDMARIESGKLSMSKGLIVIKDLLAKIDAIIESQAKQKDIEYSSAIDDSVYHSFLGDELKLQQVLINVLGNAVKFTPRGGKIKLRVEQVFFFNTEQKRKIRIIISDTGIGIKPDYLPYIFDSFSQGFSNGNEDLGGGTGLGLAISKNIITIMGGTIAVQSNEGEGTTFVIELLLPIYDEQLEIKKSAFPYAEVDPLFASAVLDSKDSAIQDGKTSVQMNVDFYKGKRILLVDDNQMNLDVAEQLLVARGFAVDIATNGEKAVEKFTSSNEGFYNLILMDVRMPKMDGLEATRHIRSSEHPNAKTIPIVAMTANAFAEDIKATQESGMNAHLSKPIDTDILFQTIACFISGFC